MKNNKTLAQQLRVVEEVEEKRHIRRTSICGIMDLDRAVLTTERKEDVRNPIKVWSDVSYAQESLEKLRSYYIDYLKGRSDPTSDETIRKYNNSLLSFLRFLSRVGEPLTLESLTPHNVNRWVSDQRANGLAEDGIASRLSAVKAFSRRWLFKTVEMTTCDLLEKVARINPPAKPFDRLTEAEQDKILDCFNKPTYEDIRNKALIACYLATGRRFSEILQLKLSELNLVSGEITVKAKGGDVQTAYISPKAIRILKRYLRERPSECVTDQVWVTAEGQPFSYWGAQSMFRRLKERTGIDRLHAHLLRHHFAQVALEKGVERAALQDMMGHKTDAMTRRYSGSMRQQHAAKQMPKYSPLS